MYEIIKVITKFSITVTEFFTVQLDGFYFISFTVEIYF